MRQTIIIGVVLLFWATIIMPITATFPNKQSPSLTHYAGDTLFVGGSGPGNYTTIQDALNASHDGDAIYVYEKPSPYKENLLLNKSVSLIAETTNTSITSNGNRSIIEITHDNVLIKGFKFIQHNYFPCINCNETSSINISNCFFDYGVGITFDLTDNSILCNDTFFNEYPYDLILSKSHGNTIEQCNFSQHIGMEILVTNGSSNNQITHNVFTTVHYWIVIYFFENTGKENKIVQNNIYGPVRSDVHCYWHENYYYDHIGSRLKLLSFLPEIIWPERGLMLNIDWHPAQQPYHFT